MSTPTLASPSSSASTNVLGFPVVAPGSSSNTTPDLYGLGAWQDQPINITGFPAAVVSALSNAGISTDQPMKASDIAHALESLKDHQAVSQMQQLLFYAGFYPSGTKLSDLQLGRFTQPDTDAFKNAIITAGRTSQALGSYLSTAASTGFSQGVINQAATVGVTPIKQVNPIDEDTALRNAAHTILGREPDQEDLAGFRAFFDQVYTKGQKDALALQAQQTAQGLPSADQLGGAVLRQGVVNPATGLPFGDANEAPPANLSPVGLPGSQGRNPDFAGPNPAYAAYGQQQQQDSTTLGSVNDALTSGQQTPTLVDAPNINSAAEDYIRTHDAPAAAQQNLATKYRTLLSIIGGNG